VSLDPVTEFISHFSGIFNIAIEQARMREQYEEFQIEKAEAEEQSDLLDINIEVHAKYAFLDFTPKVEYSPTVELVDPIYISSYVDYIPASTNVFFKVYYPFMPAQTYSMPGSGGLQQKYVLPVPPPPGSLAFALKQSNGLQDNDIMDMSGGISEYETTMDSQLQVAQLEAIAEAASLISSLGPPESEEDIAVMIQQVATEIAAYNAIYEASDNATASFDNETFGTHVNGAITNEVPLLSDHMPEPFQPDDQITHEENQNQVEGSGAINTQSSVEVVAGENLLINQISVVSAWSASPVLAVDGNVHYVNMISQVNVWSDRDTISDLLSGDSSASTATQAYNIASVTVSSNPGTSSIEGNGTEEAVFPQIWTVTRLEADLVFLNSVEQTNLVSDNDVHILTSSNSETMIITGDNVASNSLAMLDIMAGYDLIVIGGNFYSANIILQKNILLDNDAIHAIGSSQIVDHGKTDITTSDNLIWNQASIHSVGNTSFETMPDEFQTLADGLASGSHSISNAIMDNPLFTGLFGLNVLYIDGNIYDLQYISQSNILGDSDEINIVAMEIAGHSETQWEISFGENALINVAEIIDVGTDTTVFVGGEHYSDALIHQAELAPEIPINQSDNGLVSEAVIFLVDDMMEPDQGQNDLAPEQMAASSPDVDLMQTMLS